MAATTETGTARFPQGEQDLLFRRPVHVVTAHRIEEVQPALERIEQEVAGGCYTAGFLAYEAAPAFDSAFCVHHPGELPLLWFGLYEKPERIERAAGGTGGFRVGQWQALVSEPKYRHAVAHIHERIAAGDTYQVNYTFPLIAAFEGDALAWFQHLCTAQSGGNRAYVDTGRFKVLSVSPELFFSLEQGEVLTRPMKGTRPRGRWPEADRYFAQALRSSEKEQAENVMIVDLLRNDLGRLGTTGSVKVRSLYEVERYETVWQMTSTVSAATQACVPEVFAALFPSGSVTGAPKIEAMKIIRALEPHPRGVYCGTVGWWAPGRRARFNVAIRTVTVDAQRGEARYAAGSGITWDSQAAAEYRECLDKAAVLSFHRPPFALLESLLHTEAGYFLIDRHLDRLAASAAYFGFSADMATIQRTLAEYGRSLSASPAKVRLLLDRNGTVHIEHAAAPSACRVRVGFAVEPVDSRDVFLYHKTTHREVYTQACAARPDCDDVLLWNERGEITESSTANMVIEARDGRYTPPVSSGLLAGTYRAQLLESGQIREAVLTKRDVQAAQAIFLINAVRKWVQVDFAD